MKFLCKGGAKKLRLMRVPMYWPSLKTIVKKLVCIESKIDKIEKVYSSKLEMKNERNGHLEGLCSSISEIYLEDQ